MISILLEFTYGTMVSLLSLELPYVALTDSCTTAEEFQFVPSGQLTTKDRVLNVIPGDFNRDGKLDLLVMTEHSSRNGAVIDMALYLFPPRGFGKFVPSSDLSDSLENGLNLAETPPIKLASSTPAQPMTIDASGMMKIDLLGFMPSSTSGTHQLVLWNNTRADPSVVKGEFFQM